MIAWAPGKFHFGATRRLVQHTPTGTPILWPPADPDGDGFGSFSDINNIQANLGPPAVSIGTPTYDPRIDTNQNGVIDFIDVTTILSSFSAAEPGATSPRALITGSSGSGTDPLIPRTSSIGWGGAYRDERAALWLMRNRWYDDAQGRFITRDPAGYVDGLSLYLYARGNPIIYSDPFGLGAVSWWEVAQQVPAAFVQHFNERAENIQARAAGGMLTGAAAGGTVGTFIPGFGTVAGVTAGGLAGGVGGALGAWWETDDLAPDESFQAGLESGVSDGALGAGGAAVSTASKVAREAKESARAAQRAAGAADDAAKASAKEADAVEEAAEAATDAGDASQSRWRHGRYTESASRPGAYADSQGRVFPTRRNSGLSGAALRDEQRAFVERRLAEGADPAVIRGQAEAAGLTRYVDETDRLADPGAEHAVREAIERYRGSGCHR